MAAATELKEDVMSEKQLQEFWDSLYYEVNSTTLKRQPNFDKVFAAQPRQFPGEVFVPAVVRRNYKMKRLEHVYVSNYGRLWRESYTIVKKNGTQQISKEGFIRLGIANGYLTHNFIKLHRIVFFSFNKNVPLNTDSIDHIKPIHHYNYLSNLQAITKAENSKKDNGIGSKQHEATKKSCDKPVVQLRLNGEFIAFYDSAADAARSLGKKDATNINYVCLGQTKTAYGFRWMYKQQYDNGLREPIYSPPKKRINRSKFNPYETRKQLTQQELETEVWKKVYIDDEETRYEVSNMGYVRNTETGKFLTPSATGRRGNLNVQLSLDGKPYTILLHRLVAKYFVPNPNEEFLTEVNHKDENCKNCKANNLEWLNSAENIAYSNAKITKANRKARCKKVCQFDKDYNLIEIYDSVKDAGRQTGMNPSNIGACCRHRLNSASGYLWLYKSEWDKKGEASFTVPRGYVPKEFMKELVDKYQNPVNILDMNGRLYKKFDTAYQARKELNILTLYLVLNGKRKSFKYNGSWYTAEWSANNKCSMDDNKFFKNKTNAMEEEIIKYLCSKGYESQMVSDYTKVFRGKRSLAKIYFNKNGDVRMAINPAAEQAFKSCFPDNYYRYVKGWSLGLRVFIEANDDLNKVISFLEMLDEIYTNMHGNGLC